MKVDIEGEAGEPPAFPASKHVVKEYLSTKKHP
jgi:hypothetical protein